MHLDLGSMLLLAPSAYRAEGPVPTCPSRGSARRTTETGVIARLHPRKIQISSQSGAGEDWRKPRSRTRLKRRFQRSGHVNRCPRAPAAAAPGRPASAAHPAPAPRRRPAAAPADSPARPRPRSPRPVPATPPPRPAAAPPGTGRRTPAARPAAPRLRRSPPRCGALGRVDPHHHLRHQHTPDHSHRNRSAAAGMPNTSAGARASYL
jgi:hypothetical protein